ncbi:heterochromatin protein one [Hypoxylon trugodes]|uniref:heterochromatin protein one n=1 Tax=Hypoxylon trugodes TaxID=326681 RepID=UPI0021942000|nr:heterochromatin protein one [Hypoxylon trugodes]KAI1387992.1 heterochromatin protein one [Hypoxylon trugodes]
MPPAISDDEASDVGDVTVPLPTTRVKRSSTAPKVDNANDVKDTAEEDVENGDGVNGEDEDEDQAEDLEEDEFIVEKIISHSVDSNGQLKFKVKWEGYDKKSDQTWEEDENLKENASDVLEEYLASVGGREKILGDSKSALKTKKRGRPAASTPTNGAKRRRNGSHPDSATPPTTGRGWKPPVGSWEDEVDSIDACHDETSGRLIVYLTWKNGQKTQHDTKVVYQRCPQKMLQFYERHVKIVMASTDSGAKEE